MSLLEGDPKKMKLMVKFTSPSHSKQSQMQPWPKTQTEKGMNAQKV